MNLDKKVNCMTICANWALPILKTRLRPCDGSRTRGCREIKSNIDRLSEDNMYQIVPFNDTLRNTSARAVDGNGTDGRRDCFRPDDSWHLHTSWLDMTAGNDSVWSVVNRETVRPSKDWLATAIIPAYRTSRIPPPPPPLLLLLLMYEATRIGRHRPTSWGFCSLQLAAHLVPSAAAVVTSKLVWVVNKSGQIACLNNPTAGWRDFSR